MERVVGEVIYTDYPDKFAKKVDWWRTDQGLSLIRGWRAQGKSIKDVVAAMGVDPRTFRSWRKQYPEFDEAMEVGMEVANANVAQALYKRACGYDYWEETWELVEGELILVRKIKKHLPPDTKAILHWLWSRMPNEWRAVQEPIEETKYLDTIQNILIAMKNTAETGDENVVSVQDGESN